MKNVLENWGTLGKKKLQYFLISHCRVESSRYKGKIRRELQSNSITKYLNDYLAFRFNIF